MLLTLMNNTNAPLFSECMVVVHPWYLSRCHRRGSVGSHGAVRLLLLGIMWAAYQTLKQADASLQLRRARSHVCCSP